MFAYVWGVGAEWLKITTRHPNSLKSTPRRDASIWKWWAFRYFSNPDGILNGKNTSIIFQAFSYNCLTILLSMKQQDHRKSRFKT